MILHGQNGCGVVEEGPCCCLPVCSHVDQFLCRFALLFRRAQKRGGAFCLPAGSCEVAACLRLRLSSLPHAGNGSLLRLSCLDPCISGECIPEWDFCEWAGSGGRVGGEEGEWLHVEGEVGLRGVAGAVCAAHSEAIIAFQFEDARDGAVAASQLAGESQVGPEVGRHAHHCRQSDLHGHAHHAHEGVVGGDGEARKQGVDQMRVSWRVARERHSQHGLLGGLVAIGRIAYTDQERARCCRCAPHQSGRRPAQAGGQSLEAEGGGGEAGDSELAGVGLCEEGSGGHGRAQLELRLVRTAPSQQQSRQQTQHQLHHINNSNSTRQSPHNIQRRRPTYTTQITLKTAMPEEVCEMALNWIAGEWKNVNLIIEVIFQPRIALQQCPSSSSQEKDKKVRQQDNTHHFQKKALHRLTILFSRHMGKFTAIPYTLNRKAKRIQRKRGFSFEHCLHFKFAGDAEATAVGITCAICLDIMVLPHRTPCRHLFCLQCVNDLPRCPQCRNYFPPHHDMLPHHQLAAAISQYVRRRLPRQVAAYRRRLSDSRRTLRDKFYPTNKLFAGLRVDFRYGKAWHQGVITRVDMDASPARVSIAPLYLKRCLEVDVRSQQVARFRRWTLHGREDDRTYLTDLAPHRDLFEAIRATENSSHHEQAKKRRVAVLREEQERIREELSRINGETL